MIDDDRYNPASTHVDDDEPWPGAECWRVGHQPITWPDGRERVVSVHRTQRMARWRRSVLQDALNIVRDPLSVPGFGLPGWNMLAIRADLRTAGLPEWARGVRVDRVGWRLRGGRVVGRWAVIATEGTT